MAQILGAYDTNVKTSQSALKKVTATTSGTKDSLDVNITNASAVGAGEQYADAYTIIGGEKGNVALGSDGTDFKYLKTDASGNLQVDVLSGGGGVANLIDTNNSTTSTLGIGGTFVGTGTDVSTYTAVTITISTDQDSAASGMKFQFSTDNINWDDSYDFAYDVSVNGPSRRFQFPVTAKYFRFNYTNGSVAQTHFRVQTILHGENVTNANIQVADVDVSNSNPVPVSDAGGSLTVDNAGLTELASAINASSQLDINVAADAVGLATETTLSNLDTTTTSILADTASIDTSTASTDTKLTTTNTKLTDIETNTDSLAVTGGGLEATALRVTLANDSTGVLTVDDGGGSLTVDGTVSATQSGAWTIARASQIALNTDTGTGNINVSINLGATIRILGVKIHFAGVPVANDFVVTSNNLAGGPAYDTVLYKADPGTLGVTDLNFVPAGELIIEAGESLTITFTNTGLTQYGLTTTYELIA